MPGNLNLKKSWNPALVKNQEKLWIEEQNKLNEYKRIKERNEELKEEKEKLQLLKMQYGEDLNGLPSEDRLKMNKLNWMYEDPTGSKEPGFNEMNEEFLLGKKQVENMLKNNKSFKVDRVNRLESVVSVGSGESAKKAKIDDPLEKIRRERTKQSHIKSTSGSNTHSIGKQESHRKNTEQHTAPDRHRSRSRHSSSHHHRSRGSGSSSHRSRGGSSQHDTHEDTPRDRSPVRQKLDAKHPQGADRSSSHSHNRSATRAAPDPKSASSASTIQKMAQINY